LPLGSQILLRGISGSGKTTLLNIIAGLLRPTAGEVTLEGQPLYQLGEAARDKFRQKHIGYVFQSHYLLPMLTAVENIALPLALAGANHASRTQRAQELLAQVGLAEYAQHRPAQLSTGQRLRVGVARALSHQPRLLLADEPTAALDGTAAGEVMDLLQGTATAHNCLLLVASHDPAVVSRFGEIWDIQAGRVQIRKEQSA
jgi:ABC-type lipoprotein export system ATPase subunit